jgi:hypothetical protein
MTTDAYAFRRYLILYAATVAAIALPFSVNYLFLLRANEMSSYERIVREQLEREALYGTALNGNDLKYKIELVRRVRPEIVVVGSSRAITLRGLAFTRPFVNAGGASSNLLESETLVKGVLEAHVPKLVLYFVDYWWFNSRWEQGSNRYLIDETALSFAKLTSPFNWMREGKISWDLYRDVLLRGRHDSPYTRLETMGVSAIADSFGYRTDGSFFNSRWIKKDEGVLKYYGEELEAIRRGASERANLGVGDFVDDARVARYLRILDQLKQQGVQVIVVLPPVAPQYLEAIRVRAKGTYVAALVQRLQEHVAPLYDFTDFRVAGDRKCEYGDGYHPGDTLSLRLVKAILDYTPDSPLKAYVDRDKLEDYIARFADRALILERPAMHKTHEFDFLGLGCPKNSPPYPPVRGAVHGGSGLFAKSP